jgi:hypothetical protein
LIAIAWAGKAFQGTNTLAYSAPVSAANTKCFIPLTLYVNCIKPFILAADAKAQ